MSVTLYNLSLDLSYLSQPVTSQPIDDKHKNQEKQLDFIPNEGINLKTCCLSRTLSFGNENEAQQLIKSIAEKISHLYSGFLQDKKDHPLYSTEEVCDMITKFKSSLKSCIIKGLEEKKGFKQVDLCIEKNEPQALLEGVLKDCGLWNKKELYRSFPPSMNTSIQLWSIYKQIDILLVVR